MDATRRLVDVPIPAELKKRLLAVLKSTAPRSSQLIPKSPGATSARAT